MKLIDSDFLVTHTTRGSEKRALCRWMESPSGQGFKMAVTGWAPAQTTSWTIFKKVPRKTYPPLTLSMGSYITPPLGPDNGLVEPRCTIFTTSSTGNLTTEEVEGYTER